MNIQMNIHDQTAKTCYGVKYSLFIVIFRQFIITGKLLLFQIIVVKIREFLVNKQVYCCFRRKTL